MPLGGGSTSLASIGPVSFPGGYVLLKLRSSIVELPLSYQSWNALSRSSLTSKFGYAKFAGWTVAEASVPQPNLASNNDGGLSVYVWRPSWSQPAAVQLM